MTVHSASEHSHHMSRLHHHRDQVREVRAAMDAGIAEQVAAHYATTRPAGPDAVSIPSDTTDAPVTPPAAQ